MVLLQPWFRTLGAYGTAQLIIALGAFARIPILVDDLGASGYGVVVSVGGLAIVFIAIADGLAQATRVRIIELGAEGYIAAQKIQRLANTLGFLLFMALCVVAGISFLFSDELNLLVFAASVCLLFACLGIFGGPSKGVLEALGRTATANLMQTSTTLVGLPILIAALFLSPTLEIAAAVTGLGLAMPYLTSILFARGKMSAEPALIRRRHPFDSPRQLLNSETAHNIWLMVFWAWANALNYAFDALIVAVIASPEAAAEFGLASRIMTMAMLLSLGLSPLLTATVTKWRMSLNPSDMRTRLWKASAMLLSAAIVLVAFSLIIARPLSRWLSHDEIVPGWSLFVWLSVFAILSAVAMPLMAAFSGRNGVAFRTRIALICSGINIAVSIWATMLVGQVGPVIGSVTGLVILIATLFVRAWIQPESIFVVKEGPA